MRECLLKLETGNLKLGNALVIFQKAILQILFILSKKLITQAIGQPVNRSTGQPAKSAGSQIANDSHQFIKNILHFACF